MDSRQLAELLALGSEQRAAEFKSAGSSAEKPLMAKVVRAMIAMANLRDGGTVVVGVAEADGGLLVEGMNPAAIASWLGDDFRDRVAAYTDPYIEFTAEQLEHAGHVVVVIRVQEFDEIPVICRKSYGTDLHEGTLYVRSRRKPESVPVRSLPDMRDVIELATSKSLRRLVARMQEAGVNFGVPSPAELFDQQLEDLL